MAAANLQKKLHALVFTDSFLIALMVVSLVLYLGWDRAWRYSASLAAGMAISSVICNMIGISIAAALPSISEPRSTQILRAVFVYFFFFIVVSYFVQMHISWEVARLSFRLTRLANPGFSSSWSEFLFAHLLLIYFISGAAAGCLLNFKGKHQVAAWIWIIPAVVLAHSMWITLQEYSVLEDRVGNLFSYFFSYCNPPRDLLQRLPEDIYSLPQSCADQFSYTAPFFAAVGFSLGALLARIQPRKAGKRLESNSSPIRHQN